MKKMKSLAVLAAVLLTACENTTYPLVFVSQNTVGLEVSGPAADNPGGGSIVIGYKSRDAALVPTGVILSDEEKKYKVLTLLNGCANDGAENQNGDGNNPGVGDCSAHVTHLSERQARENAEAVMTELATISAKAKDLAAQEKNDKIKAKLDELADPENMPKYMGPEQAQILGEASAVLEVSDDTKVQTLARDIKNAQVDLLSDPATARRATRVDSYSVFSSFNAASQAGAADGRLSAGLSLGKLFATGVAAQRLGSGMAENLKNSATQQMSKTDALAGCVNLLKAENDGASKPGDTDKCLNFLAVVEDTPPAASTPEISVADVSASENAGTMTFELTRSPAIGISKVSYAANDVSAVAGTDYTLVPGEVTFSDGDDKKTVDITLIDNAAQDGDKTLDLALTVTQNAVLKAKQARGTITDDD